MAAEQPSSPPRPARVPETLRARMAAPRKKHDQGAVARLVARLGDRLALALMVLTAAAIIGLVVTIAANRGCGRRTDP